MHRAAALLGHLQPVPTQVVQEQRAVTGNDVAAASTSEEKGYSAADLRWNGWGYSDTEFAVNDQGLVYLAGNRYLFSGKVLPDLRKWMEENAGLDMKNATPPQQSLQAIPAAVRNEEFLAAVQGRCGRISSAAEDRVFHAHGHTCQEVYALRFGQFERIPDLVIYPKSTEHVEAVVKAAHAHNVVIIPFGGGTSVSQALICPPDEKRMIVSLDMHDMNQIKWINHKNMMACIEAGAIGKELEERLGQYGFCMGHEPDSMEFSSLGGWVATRASGMKKNKYGNIEDIVVRMKIVTPIGTWEKGCAVPRMSTGPDINHLVLGSEGTLGVVTEVVVRLRPLPKSRKYGSMVFPDFESGVSCLHEVAIKRAQPASIRLVDNMQFKFSQALKPPKEGWKEDLTDRIKKWYVIKHKGFDVNKMVAATLLFEGSPQEITEQERQVYEIAAKYGGMRAGEENGIRGYFLTYMIAYLRDFGLNYSFIAESFETSVPWDRVLVLCNSVKDRIRKACADRGVVSTPFVSSRVTQVYDTGACVYFYFGFIWKGLKDPVRSFSEIEEEARDEILRLGGSLSHHHGVGKLRKQYLPQTVGEHGLTILRGVKQTIDPKNIFANGNLI